MSGSHRLAAGCLLAMAFAACGAGGQPTPAGTSAVTVELAAHSSAFDKASLSVLADATFAIAFDNRDHEPHNVTIHGNGQVRTGEIFPGPAERTYTFAALPAGTYAFQCDVHPWMTGTLVVGGTASVR